MKEALVSEISQLRGQMSEQERNALVVELRATKSDIDGRRVIDEWRRGVIYFHSVQDLSTAVVYLNTMKGLISPDKMGEVLKSSQACFVKDLDFYFEGFPADQTDMREVFQAVFETGTSVRWNDDEEFVRGLHHAYQALDETVIRPWVNESPN